MNTNIDDKNIKNKEKQIDAISKGWVGKFVAFIIFGISACIFGPIILICLSVLFS